MKAIGILFIALLGTGCVSEGKYDKAVNDARVAHAELDRTRSDVQACSTRKATLEKNLATRTKQLDDSIALNGQLKDELASLGKNADALVAENGELSASLALTRTRLEELRHAQAAAEARAVLYRELARKLKRMVDDGDLSIVIREGRMTLVLPNEVLFDTARTEIKPAGQKALRTIANVMTTLPNRRYQIVGHTDTVPIHNERFASNWELSAGRSLEVLHFLVMQGVEPAKLSAAGYGEMDPIATNDSVDGRRKNRRTEIALQPNIDEIVAIPP